MREHPETPRPVGCGVFPVLAIAALLVAGPAWPVQPATPAASTSSARARAGVTADRAAVSRALESALGQGAPNANAIGPRQTAGSTLPGAGRPSQLKDLNLYPDRALIGRYAPPPPPWLHVHIRCVIDDGTMYISGDATGNLGHPIPGVTEYIGRGGNTVGRFTSSLSGHFGGAVALPGTSISAPANMHRTPMPCAHAHVGVGAPTHVK